MNLSDKLWECAVSELLQNKDYNGSPVVIERKLYYVLLGKLLISWMNINCWMKTVFLNDMQFFVLRNQVVSSVQELRLQAVWSQLQNPIQAREIFLSSKMSKLATGTYLTGIWITSQD